MEEPEEMQGGTSSRQPRGGARRTIGRAVAAVGLVALGALGATVLRQPGHFTFPWTVTAAPNPASQPAPQNSSPAAPAATAATEDVEVLLTPDALSRIGIKTSKVTTVDVQRSVTVPGTVMPHGYREVKVTPIVGGIVTKLNAELGTRVARGAPLATLFSAELADAQTKYLSMAAMVDADHKKLERTQELVGIGAASRQELEEVSAVHTSHATEAEAARQRLLLLGLSPEQVQRLTRPDQVVSTMAVPAPIGGVITSRSVNLGQVVGMGQELFVVTDLSEVWVVGDLYEQDFRSVRVGSEARITSAAYPDMALRGRVSYIDPRVESQTRTAKVRVEVADSAGRLKLGLYVVMEFLTRDGERRPMIPRTAVQTLGERQVVFLPVQGEEGKFLQRVVRLGPLEGDRYPVLDGVKPGDEVVTDGSFFLRAESLRNAPSG